MLPKLTQLLLFTVIYVFDSIESRIWSEKYSDDGLLYLKLSPNSQNTVANIHNNVDSGRAKRSAPTPVSDKIDVQVSLLKDASHNEAIVHWTGKESTVMFILSRQHSFNGSVTSSTLWRSENYGGSFNEVLQFKSGTIISYYLSAPNDKKKLLFVDKHRNTIYRTVTEGQQYEDKGGCPGSSDKLLFHPTDETKVLCYSEHDRKLYMTSDFCDTWDLVHEFVNPRFSWGIPGYDTDMDIVHMEVLDPQSSHYVYKAVTSPYPTDATMDNHLGAIEVDSLLVINEYIFVQKKSQYATWLYVSWRRQPFEMAYFPKNTHPEDLNIIDADESQVFIAGSLQSSSTFYSLAELFLSDTRGQVYISSLDRVTSIGLKEIHGLRGVYIANPRSGVGNSAMLTTKITFDQGGKWSRIPAPDKDAKGKAINCKLSDDCSLHLQNIVSEATAPGILLAQGNYGKGFHGYDNVTLFMSTDGGVTWSFTLDKMDYYEANILDQGGAVVAVPQTLQDSKNVIHYSHDEGTTWQDFIYKNDSMRVDAVLNDPGAKTRNVVIFGHDEKRPGWVIVMIDFSKMLTTPCTDNDYADWIPTDQDHNQCLLGQQIRYKRRKADVECYNGQDYTKGVAVKNCTCTLEDYECDYGYEVDDAHIGTCKISKWYNADKPVGNCPEGEFYMKTKGYRKVAADMCSPDKPNLAPVHTACPIMAAEGLHVVVEGGHKVKPINEPVHLMLIQERGSKKSTQYIWNFGDDDKSNYTHKGYTGARSQNHTYTKRGTYTITVWATNSNGMAQAKLIIIIEDKIEGLTIETPHGAQINVPIQFTVTVSGVLDKFFSSKPGVHFMWKFGDELSEKSQTLTWDTEVRHTFKNPGNYTVFVEAMNSVDAVFSIVQIPVYGTLTTVQMMFDDGLDEINDGTLLWNNLFAKTLREALLKELDIDVRRLEVVVLKATLRTVADISVLPTVPNWTKDQDNSIARIVSKLLGLPKNKTFQIQLTTEEFRVQHAVTVTSAVIFTDEPEARNYVAVYVCVPILIAAIFVSMLVVLYYKKTFSSARRRYRLLHGQGGPEPDNLLDDTDDDDPPLDLNSDDATPQRLALSDDDTLVTGGAGDPLVSFSGLLSSDRRNQDV